MVSYWLYLMKNISFTFFSMMLQNIKLVWAKLKINENELFKNKQNNKDSYKKAIKSIEIITESIPQMTLQIYIILKMNEKLTGLKALSIITSGLSIVFGLSDIFSSEVFCSYLRYDKNKASIKYIIYHQVILILFYFGITLPRIFMISMIAAYNMSLCIVFVITSLGIYIPINLLERKAIQNGKKLKRIMIENTVFEVINYNVSFSTCYLVFTEQFLVVIKI